MKTKQTKILLVQASTGAQMPRVLLFRPLCFQTAWPFCRLCGTHAYVAVAWTSLGFSIVPGFDLENYMVLALR